MLKRAGNWDQSSLFCIQLLAAPLRCTLDKHEQFSHSYSSLPCFQMSIFSPCYFSSFHLSILLWGGLVYALGALPIFSCIILDPLDDLTHFILPFYVLDNFVACVLQYSNICLFGHRLPCYSVLSLLGSSIRSGQSHLFFLSPSCVQLTYLDSPLKPSSDFHLSILRWYFYISPVPCVAVLGGTQAYCTNLCDCFSLFAATSANSGGVLKS